MTFILRFRRLLVIAAHLVLAIAGYALAYALRFDFVVPEPYRTFFWSTLPAVVALRLVSFHLFGIYRGYWQHVSLRDLADLVQAASASTVALAVLLAVTGQVERMPGSILMLDWLLAIFLSGGIRFGARWVREWRLLEPRRPERRTIVIGAGDAAEQLLRQCGHDGQAPIRVVGLVDDDPAARARSLHGVPVLGTTAQLASLAIRHRAELLVIAIAAATAEQMRRLVARCMETGLEFKIIPSLQELIEGRGLRQLREVRIEDLLGREPVRLELDEIKRDIAGRVVLVTGAAGSIGSELARQVARFGPARLVLLEQAESPLYFVHLDICRDHPDVPVVPVIADITDRERIDQVFRAHRPEYVFHAAAYKHVPMMEANVVEAVHNNVLGTLAVAQCAARHGARKVVLISTDKAVNPTSIMGATKRLAERIGLGVRSLRASGTDFRAVRFGNVLGSDGSVVPLFKRQIAAGGPVTITHPDVTRYFMTIPEAVQLVLQAAALPEAAGRICMLEMGAPVRIVDLAEQLIRLSGLVPGRDIAIEYTGLRPGEKLNEELVSDREATIATSGEKIRVVQTVDVDGPALEHGLTRLAHAVAAGREDLLLRVVCELVPEYCPQRDVAMDVEVPLPGAPDHAAPAAARVRAPTSSPVGGPGQLQPAYNILN